jgi:flavorubredoxin
MPAREIKSGVYSVGAIDWDRKLFDELIPLPDGTSYNAYLIKGTLKTALIDTVDPAKEGELIANLEELEVDKIDYVIASHAEQDHSGSIPKILELYPDAKVVVNPKCKTMLMDLLSINDDKFITIGDGEILSLGDNETMLTYLKEDKILFTCDFLGSHFASDKLFVEDEAALYIAAKRYYAEIMMPFRAAIRKNIEKISELEIDIIAPSHGQVYKNPGFIINAYRNWISDEVKNEVVIPYVSMHGSTAKMVEYFVNALKDRGIRAKPFNLTEMDLGELAIAIVESATVVVGSPTVLTGPHPAVVYAASLLNALRPKTKFVSIIGSYGWGGKMVEQVKGMLPNLKVELLEPVIVKGYPKKEDFESLNARYAEILWRFCIQGKGSWCAAGSQ